jgi:hypothetical protein
MNPPKGYYRNLISDSNIRIAFTHTPIHGCTIVDKSKTLEELEKSNDQYSQYYIDGLKSGNMVTIVENSVHDRYFRTGELYFSN